MVDPEAIRARLRALAGYRAQLAAHAQTARDDFVAEPDTHDLAERRLHLAVECMLDVANHVIADEGFEPASTYRDAFRVLAVNGILSDELGARLAGWAGLRNVLVHLYLGIDHSLVYDIIAGELDDLDSFATEIREWLGRQGH